VNVTNKDPTVCINDLVQRLNDLDSRSKPELFSVEELIARSLSVLEDLIDKFETKEGRRLILDQYYTHWLHRQAILIILVIFFVINCLSITIGMQQYFINSSNNNMHSVEHAIRPIAAVYNVVKIFRLRPT